MSLPRVVVTHRVHPEIVDYLRTFAAPLLNQSDESLPPEELAARLADAQGLLAFMPDRVDAAFLACAPRLRVIGAALRGYDNFDIDACTERRVWFCPVPDLLTAPTADLAIALLLGLTRHIGPGDAFVRTGQFTGWRPVLYGSGLSDMTICLVGFGQLGRAVARRLAGFRCEVTYCDPRRAPLEDEAMFNVRPVTEEEALRTSGALLLLAPLLPATLHWLNAERLALMRPGSYVINMARGSLVDEHAIAAALASGHLAGYAADVFEMEDRARPDHPRCIPDALLAQRDRTLFTPHLGSAVASIRLEIERSATHQIEQALTGRPPDHAINGGWT